MRTRFLAAPDATPAEFERQWPALLDAVQKEQALHSMDTREEYRRYRRATSVAAPE
jgi:hypothetical protein